MKIIDISIPVNNDSIAYPKNPGVEIVPELQIPGDSANVSKITMGSHTGTHVDADLHVKENGEPIEKQPLENFIGPCKVIDLSEKGPGELIMVPDLESSHISEGDRVLIKTSNSERGYDEFYEDFVAISGDAADFLAEKNIVLIGVDYLSIKQKGSTDNRAHTSFLDKNISIIEGLNLKDVDAGEYELFCPPVRFDGLDGAPCRAVLIKR